MYRYIKLKAVHDMANHHSTIYPVKISYISPKADETHEKICNTSQNNFSNLQQDFSNALIHIHTMINVLTMSIQDYLADKHVQILRRYSALNLHCNINCKVCTMRGICCNQTNQIKASDFRENIKYIIWHT